MYPPGTTTTVRDGVTLKYTVAQDAAPAAFACDDGWYAVVRDASRTVWQCTQQLSAFMRFPCGGKGGPASCNVDYAAKWCGASLATLLGTHGWERPSLGMWAGCATPCPAGGIPSVSALQPPTNRETDCTNIQINGGRTGDELDGLRSFVNVTTIGLEDNFRLGCLCSRYLAVTHVAVAGRGGCRNAFPIRS